MAENASDELKNAPVPALEDAYSGGSLPGHPDSLNIHKRDLEGGQMARDMNLFVDDDGKAYHIYASEENSTLQIAQLNDDYTDHNGCMSVVLPVVSWKLLPCSSITGNIT